MFAHSCNGQLELAPTDDPSIYTSIALADAWALECRLFRDTACRIQMMGMLMSGPLRPIFGNGAITLLVRERLVDIYMSGPTFLFGF